MNIEQIYKGIYTKRQNEATIDWFNSLPINDKYLVASYKFYDCITKYGWELWVENGYAEIMIDILIDFVNNILKLDNIVPIFLHEIKTEAPIYNWGDGWYTDLEEWDCNTCDGTGEVSCPECDGEDENCDICFGTGYVFCPDCEGSGSLSEEIEIRNIDSLSDEIYRKYDFDEEFSKISDDFLNKCEKYFKKEI